MDIYKILVKLDILAVQLLVETPRKHCWWWYQDLHHLFLTFDTGQLRHIRHLLFEDADLMVMSTHSYPLWPNRHALSKIDEE